MGFFDGVLGGIISAGTNVWNVKQQEKQNQINRQREDNAIQRRRSDLEAAGLNPNLAAGSAASSSNMAAPQLDNSAIGDYLDYKAAKEQIRRTEQETQIAKFQKDYWDTMSKSAENNYNLETINQLLSLGFSPEKIKYTFDGNQIKLMPSQNMYWEGDKAYTSFGPIMGNLGNSYLYNQFNLQKDLLNLDRQNVLNNAFMLQVDKDWYKANKWINAIGDVTDIGMNMAKPFIPKINLNQSTYEGHTRNENYNRNYSENHNYSYRR